MWATNGGHAETMTVLVVTLRHEGRRRYDKILSSSFSQYKLRYAKSDFYFTVIIQIQPEVNYSDPTRGNEAATPYWMRRAIIYGMYRRHDVGASPPRSCVTLQLWARENAILSSLCSYGLGKRCEA